MNIPALLFTFLLYFSSMMSFAQAEKSPVEVVQLQLDAYNKQDLALFCSVFSEDVLVYKNLGDSLPSMRGRAEVEKQYGAMFKKYPSNKSTLIGRMQEGNFVIDHEWITGREKEMRIMALYEVKAGLISRCWFIRSAMQ
jgi:hypothetical protein